MLLIRQLEVMGSTDQGYLVRDREDGSILTSRGTWERLTQDSSRFGTEDQAHAVIIGYEQAKCDLLGILRDVAREIENTLGED